MSYTYSKPLKAAVIFEALAALRTIKDLPADAGIGAHWIQVQRAHSALEYALSTSSLIVHAVVTDSEKATIPIEVWTNIDGNVYAADADGHEVILRKKL